MMAASWRVGSFRECSWSSGTGIEDPFPMSEVLASIAAWVVVAQITWSTGGFPCSSSKQ